MTEETVAQILANIKLQNSSASDELIKLLITKATKEVEVEAKKPYDTSMDNVIEDIVVVKLNKLGNEGLSSTSASGMSDNYLDTYPDYILRQLNALKGRVRIL